jgi:hypothetical protein
VIAHEVGHLSKNHARDTRGFFRLRQTWARILNELSKHKSKSVFNGFIAWYAPLFDAYTFVLARQNEYAADRCAADLAGKSPTASALVRISTHADYLAKVIGPDLSKEITCASAAPTTYYSRVVARLASPIESEATLDLLQVELRQRSGTGDPHPCLRDRLAAIGVPHDLENIQDYAIRSVPVSSLESLLGKFGERVIEDYDKEWQLAVEQKWKDAHEAFLANTAMLDDLNAKAAAGEALELKHKYKRAALTVEFLGNESGMAIWQEILSENADDNVALYNLGCLELAANDQAGIARIERAMKSDIDLIMPGCGAIYHFLTRQGRHDEARAYRDRYMETQKLEAQDRASRSTITKTDALYEHRLDPATIEKIREICANIKHIDRVYAVSRYLERRPREPLHCLVVTVRTKFGIRSDDRTNETRVAIVRAMSGSGIGCFVTDLSWLQSKAKSAPNSLIYAYKLHGALKNRPQQHSAISDRVS